MAIGTRERIELRDQLTSQGYHWNYIDEWQPKVTLYRHHPMISPSGEVVSPAGKALPNLPGNPDYVSKKARIGLFTWPPSDTCACRWCSNTVTVVEGASTPVDSGDTLQPVVARKTRARGRPTS
jgi:hypothetical protein